MLGQEGPALARLGRQDTAPWNSFITDKQELLCDDVTDPLEWVATQCRGDDSFMGAACEETVWNRFWLRENV